MAAHNPTQRFSSRVENYIRYRPGYPAEVVQLLKEECGLNTESLVADIAFGTGIFTRLLLKNGNRVIGVEPNPDMRKAGEEFLAAWPRFTSVNGTAEATTLLDHSVDLVTAAQAAHWFDRDRARKEFIRILKPGGFAMLIWNERRLSSTPFLRDYENLLLTYGTDYENIRHEKTTDDIDKFFSPSPFHKRKFETLQETDYPALEGRLLSSSYVPQQGHVNYEAMLRDLHALYDAHRVKGKVVLEYNTLAFYGQLT